MPKIVPIVEGPGEADAVPELLTKVLADLSRPPYIAPNIKVATPKIVHGVGNLARDGDLERFLRHACNEPDAAAVLIIRDADKGCPRTMAKDLAARTRALNPPIPVAVVIAKREFEAWIVASLETVAGKSIDGRPGILEGTTCGDPEEIGDVKGWIGRHMPPGRSYKETTDQGPMTRLIDSGLAYTNSRSFRRFWKAVSELVDAIDNNAVLVTPNISD